MGFFTNIKQGIASVALGAMAFAVLPLNAQAQLMFSDVMEIPSWSVEAIEELMDQGVISGNDDGSFAPNRQLNRAEVSKIIVLATGLPIDTSGGSAFPDVTEGDWFYDYVVTMYNYGYINGYPDGLFRPGVGINRAEMAKMVVNAFELDQDLSGAPHFGDVSSSDWFYGFVETAYNAGLMRGYGDGSFGPANAVTRAETVKIVYDAQLAVMAPVGPADGTLEVALSMDTPRGTNIPYNATSVPFLTVEMTASDDSDVEVSSMTFTRLGLGDNDDFKKVWLEIDGFKIGNDKSVNNADIAELRFNPPIVIPAGMTLMADLVASTKFTGDDQNVGHYNRFAVVSAQDIVSSALNVVGDFPIEGEEMQVTSYEVSQLRFSALGSDTTIEVGNSFVEVGKFRILNGSNTNKDVELRAITFKNDGTAEVADAFENLSLYVSGEQISAETIIDGDYVTFRLDNGITGGYVVEDGDSRIFSIRADVVSAERNDTINFKVDNYEDIVGVEIGTAFGVRAVAGDAGRSLSTSNNAQTTATSPACVAGTNVAEDNCARLYMYSVDSGDLNVSRDPASLGNQEYAPGSNDVVFMTARLVVDQPLLADGVNLYIASGSTVDGDDKLTEFNNRFDNFRLYLNDRMIDSENDFVGDTDCTVTATSCYLEFDTTFEIAGTSILKLVGNITQNAEDDDQIKLSVSATNFSSVEYISTGDQVSTSQLLGSATSSFVQVQQSSLVISRTDGLPSGQELVAGVDDMTFLGFVLDNNDSGDVNVTSITIAADTDANTTNAGDGVSGSARTYSNFTGAIFVDGVQQGSAKNFTSTGSATFNDLSTVIPSASQKEFTLVIDTIEASATDIATTISDAGGAVAESGVATWTVTSTTGMTVGDLLVVTDGTNTDVRAITAIVDADSVTVDSAAGNNYAAGDTVTIRHQIKFDVSDVDADNVENGQSVEITPTSIDGNLFVLVDSGSLTVSMGSTVFSDIIVAGQKEVEIGRIRFNASDDEVHIKDIRLENDVNADGTVDNEGAGDRVDFKLYNEAGQLIQTKQMVNGALHFQLANQDRIRVPKDDSTFVTMKVDARAITQAAQTGARLALSLDEGHLTKGIEAITAATGSDISTPAAAAGWQSAAQDVTTEDFVIYRSQISVNHASAQPNFQDPSTASQEIYRFTVTSDAARQTELGRATFRIDLSGMETAANASFVVRQVKADGTIDNSANVATTSDTFTAASDVSGNVTVSFTNQKLSAGESRTYALFMDQTTNTGGGDADDDAVSVTILQDTTYAAPNTRTAQALVGTTLTVAGATLDADPAAGNITVGGQTIAVDMPDFATTAQMATTIAAAIDGNANFSASANGSVVTITSVDTKTITSSTIDTTALIAAIYAADGTDDQTITADQTATRMIWSDESSSAHSDTTADWLNGYLIDVDTTANVNAD